MKTHRNDRRQMEHKPFNSMNDIHHHLGMVNTYDRRPDLKPYTGRKPNHKAHELLMKHHLGFDKAHKPHN